MKQTIRKRKSTRNYTGVPVEEPLLGKVSAHLKELKPLYPNIAVHAEIVTKEQVRCFFPWTPPQFIAVYSEEADGYLENVGFLFQQMDLYLQSMGLGVCWIGMGRMSENEPDLIRQNPALKFVILLAFGYPKDTAWRQDASEFKRHELSQIADTEDERLEPARLAPSSINSQPWYFTHEGDVYHAYRTQPTRIKSLVGMNRIDMGIALAQLFVENPDTFRFFSVDSPAKIKGCHYTGSFCL